jgi:hypothetical protein
MKYPEKAENFLLLSGRHLFLQTIVPFYKYLEDIPLHGRKNGFNIVFVKVVNYVLYLSLALSIVVNDMSSLMLSGHLPSDIEHYGILDNHE